MQMTLCYRLMRNGATGQVDRLFKIGSAVEWKWMWEHVRWWESQGNQPSAIQIVMDEKQLEIVEYFSYLGRRITSDARCTLDIKSRIVMAKAAFSNGKLLHQQTGPPFKDEASEALHLEHSFVWYWNWTVREGGQKCLKRFQVWCWRRTEKFSWTACIKVKKNYVGSRGRVTLILLTWRIWWAPNNASKWQMGFNSAFKGVISYRQ